MDVSVVIPFYNNVEWLYEAVNSIREESDLSFEIIIVDDGSKEEIDIKKFENKNKLKIIRQINQGPGKARNIGISESVGEYIAFLDSDDLFVINKLTIQLKFMRESGDMWSHSSFIKFYETGREELVDTGEFYGEVFPSCLAYNPIATPTVMVKRAALENPQKRFSENMRYGQDGFMWSQLAAYNSVGVISKPLTMVRMRGTNATLSARNHLYVKSKMYSYLIESDKYYNGKKIPILLKVVFAIANFNYKILEQCFSGQMNKPYVEQFSRILYSSQYFVLRFYKFKYKK